MAKSFWRPVTALLLGALAWFGTPVIRTLTFDRVPELWVQIPAATLALLLLWQEWRSPTKPDWRLLAWVGGLMGLCYLLALGFLALIWPR